MGIFGRTLVETEYNGYHGVDYGVYDTLFVSYSRYSEIKRLMQERPFEERSKVVPSVAVGHFVAYYADSYGNVTKWKIEADNE
jgi:hypothetical protein